MKTGSQDPNELFRALVDGVRDYAIFILDPAGNIVTWNTGAERIKGYLAHEIIGKHFSVFYPPDALAADWPATELRAATSEGRFEDENWRIRKDGTRFWANVIITAIRNPAGELIGFSKITRDLTERMESVAALRDTESRYRGMFEGSRDGVLIVNAVTHQIIDANPAIAVLLGRSREELLGKLPWEIGLFRDEDANRTAQRMMLEQGYVRHDDVVLSRGDSDLEVELQGNRYEVAGQPAIQYNVRDIRERRQLERALRQTESMAEVNRRKDEFLALLSHELRNPLSAITNAVELQRMQPEAGGVPGQIRAIIERQVGRLTSMVEDLLEVSRIATGRHRLNLESVEGRELVEHAVETVRPLREQKNHTLALKLSDAPIWLDADPVRVEQVAVNLLTNAVKYTPTGGHIEVCFEIEDGKAVLRVKDNGVGITADLLPHIFELFTQADRTLHRSEGGLGVGLTVVQRVVQLHGGTVEANSAGLNQGAEFIVRLPVSSPQHGERPEADRASATGRRRLRVVVVDDNRDSADTIAMLLEGSGRDVRVEYTGPDGLETVRSFRPDAVLLDIGLPGLDGYEVARAIRRDPELSGVKLIAVSGYGQESDRRRSKDAGFDVHMVKPVEPQTIEDALNAVTGT